jgi:hypothetical protein
MGCCKSKQALILLLMRFLYVAILITTKQQCTPQANSKADVKAAPDLLMMSIAATPLSNTIKNKFSNRF